MNAGSQLGDHKKYWLLGLGVACAAIVIAGFVVEATKTRSIEELVGYAIGSAAIAAAVFTLVFGRLWRGMGGAVFGAFIACIFAAAMVSNERARSAGNTFLNSIQTDIIGQVEDFDPDKPLEAISTAPSQGGTFGIMEEFVRTNFNEQVDHQRRYMAALDALGIESLFDIERLKNDPDLSQSIGMVENARRVVSQYRGEDERRVESIPSQLQALQISAADRKAAEKGFNDAMEIDRPDWQRTWELETQMVEDFATVVDLLKAQEGQWIVESDQITFEDGDAADAYNALLASIDEKVAAQEAVAKRLAERMEARLRRAKTTLNQ